MQPITREQVREQIATNTHVKLVEALPEKNFREFHLPGAINIPLNEEFDENVMTAIPDKSTPVIVYCKDASCNASPQAAKRLEELGYSTVYDYTEGKEDWREAGGPIEH